MYLYIDISTGDNTQIIPPIHRPFKMGQYKVPLPFFNGNWYLLICSVV